MTTSILIATDNIKDAQSIETQLNKDYKDIFVVIGSQSPIRDFDSNKPDILVLAFKSLAMAEDYYSELYHKSTQVTSYPHRSILLCNKDELELAYQACKQEHFDDYVLFWPTVTDDNQLSMAIHRAQLTLERAKAYIANRELSKQSRHLNNLDSKFEAGLNAAHEHLETIDGTTLKLNQTAAATLGQLLERLNNGDFNAFIDIKDANGFKQLLEKFQHDLIAQHISHINQPLKQLKTWLQEFRSQFSPHFESVRLLKDAAQKIPPTILVVDDDKFALDLSKAALVKENFTVTLASNGYETLKILSKQRPDLILMDMNMPEIDGLEATRRIKAMEQFSTIPIIMVTGNNTKADVINCLKAGASDYIVKPISHGTLIDKINRLLQ
ncbi:MAG: response regulator [Methylococcales bacterium]|nr:MAG: response regulator [Methylococcales bacterium]